MKTIGFTLKRYVDRIDKMSVRERSLVLAALIGVVAFVAYQFALAPQLAAQSGLREQIAALSGQNEKLRGQVAELRESYNRDLTEESKARLAQLEQRLAQLDPALTGVTRALVTPQEMARLMEEILRRNRSLEVLKLASLPAAPLLAPPAPAEATPGAPAPEAAARGATADGLYKHGMVIEVRGRYPDLVNYLGALEELPWKLFWGEVTLQAEAYPQSRLRLVVYTLSQQQKWIGL
jgi:MSHA biogenesis protein MshJ